MHPEELSQELFKLPSKEFGGNIQELDNYIDHFAEKQDKQLHQNYQ